MDKGNQARRWDGKESKLDKNKAAVTADPASQPGSTERLSVII